MVRSRVYVCYVPTECFWRVAQKGAGVFLFELVRLTGFEDEVGVVVQSSMEDAFRGAEIEITSLFVKGSTLLVPSRAELDSWGASTGGAVHGGRTSRGCGRIATLR